MHIVVFCHLRWDFVQQRPQHVLSRLAAHHDVTFVEEPIRCESERGHLEVLPGAPNIRVLRPHTPGTSSGFSGDQIGPLRLLLNDYLAREAIAETVVWFYTPMALPLLAALRPAAVVYDCMDELSAFKGAPQGLCELEAQLLQVADIVFTGGPSLYRAKRDRNPNVFCLPSAVDAAHFSSSSAHADRRAMSEAAAAQGTIGHPRLGFFGVIDERLDLQLLSDLARAQPTWQLVMVGPVVKISTADLPRLVNIHWLGQQPYALLPQLVASWDVCLLPFALNASTEFISPTKTLEYMAAGKPVVSTPVTDVVSMYGPQVRIARAGLEFEAACRAALDETSIEATTRQAMMQETVARSSWDQTARTMHAEITRVLAHRETLSAPV